MKTSTPGRRPGRPTSAQVRSDCREIARMFAAGENESGIRSELGLSRRAYTHRLRVLRRTSVDRHIAWARFLAGAQADLVRLHEIGETALASKPPRFSLFVRVTAMRARLRREIVEVGVSLGVYDLLARPRGPADEHALRFRDLFGVPDIPHDAPRG